MRIKRLLQTYMKKYRFVKVKEIYDKDIVYVVELYVINHRSPEYRFSFKNNRLVSIKNCKLGRIGVKNTEIVNRQLRECATYYYNDRKTDMMRDCRSK